VVCGLAVRCDPCDECTVTIEPGYAIDCCGNDIVLCEPASFNVCDYIEKCLREKPVCEDKIRPRSRCDDLPKEYCLIVSYNEEHVRPMTALIRDNGCTVNRCEPSRTREIFRFDLIEKKDAQGLMPQPSLWDKLKDCAKVFSRLNAFSGELSAAQEQQQEGNLNVFHTTVFGIFCRMRAYILELYKKGPNIRCNLVAELREIEESFPAFTEDPRQRPEYLRQVNTAVFRMYAGIFQFFMDCVCDALLVPCTECGTQEGVLLACLTMEGNKVTKICNTVRQQVISGPALRYWLQPLYAGMGNLLEFLCCTFDPNDLFRRALPTRETGFTNVNRTFTRGATAFTMARDYASAAWERFQPFNFLQFMGPETLTAMDVYNRPEGEVLQMLHNRTPNIGVGLRRVNTQAEAYSLRNLADMLWVVPSDSTRVELVVSPAPENLVTCIRVLGEED
jgi:hypothetical protein